MTTEAVKRGWLDTLKAYRHPRVVTMLFLGFSAGLPILLIFSTLSLWLREADVSRATVTYFSWAALGYSFKFIWAPIVDKMPLPVLDVLMGRRRSWLLIAQLAVIVAILWMGFVDPSVNLTAMAFAAVMLGFSSATQDIVIDAYRIESASADLQALLSSTYIAGYRIGMLVAGAGGLKLAAHWGSETEYIYSAWKWTYICMAGTMSIGIITTLLISEPDIKRQPNRYLSSLRDYLRFLVLFALVVAAFVCVFFFSSDVVKSLKTVLVDDYALNTGLAGFLVETLRMAFALLIAYAVSRISVNLGVASKQLLQETYIEPLANFFSRYGKPALLILALVGIYRVSDIVLGVISNVFYKDLGFSKDQIANIVKFFGLWMTILGGFLGGGLAFRYGVLRILFIGGVLAAATNILFMFLAQMGNNEWMLILVISADNLSAGLASAAFVAYLSSLTDIRFTALQYALFSSIMTLFPKLLAGYSGGIVDSIGYESFFLFTAILGVPVLVLIYYIGRIVPIDETAVAESEGK